MPPEGTRSGAGHHPLILIVDDYQDTRTMYASYLALSGFRVAEAGNGLEAIRMAQAVAPDLILMDVSLPGVDGWEACRRLKADAGTRAIRVVMLTAHSLTADQIEASCDGLIRKPCPPDVLLEEISRYLDGERGTA
jgi:CheY-like chemotaxis protein